MPTPAEAPQTLVDNLPPKCPYFTLPDVSHFPKEIRVSNAGKTTGYVSIISLWGPSGKMTEETTTDFLLQLLKHSNWEPDFEAIAAEWQLNGTSYIKSRLKSIVEGKGYKLVGESKVVDGTARAKPAAPLMEKAKAKKEKPTENDTDGDASKVIKASKARRRKAAASAEASKSGGTKKQRQAAEAIWTMPESPGAESQQGATVDGHARVSAGPEASAPGAGAEEVGSQEEVDLET